MKSRKTRWRSTERRRRRRRRRESEAGETCIMYSLSVLGDIKCRYPPCAAVYINIAEGRGNMTELKNEKIKPNRTSDTPGTSTEALFPP